MLRQLRLMSNLASRFVGGAEVHVVDPQVDLRHIFEDESNLKNTIELRNLKVEVDQVQKDYEKWFEIFQRWKAAEKDEKKKLKKELREHKKGILEALQLPNFVHSTGTKNAPLLKSSKHSQFLAQQGLMRIDKVNHVVHLTGFPVFGQSLIRAHLRGLFSVSQSISPSYFARAAILEALNVDKSKFVQFTDKSSNFPETYLVGHSFAALVSPFLKTCFSEKNEWPIVIQSTGAAYHEKKNTIDLVNARQRMKHCLLIMLRKDSGEDEMAAVIQDILLKIAAFFDEGLLLELTTRELRGEELKNHESQAFVIENKGLVLTRISRIGDYVSRRLNVVYSNPSEEEKNATEFVNMVYAETDVDRILARLVDSLVDGNEPPKLIRDAMKNAKQ